MTSPVFPDIEGALNWYVATKDGLFGLREAIRCGAALSATTDGCVNIWPVCWSCFAREMTWRTGVFCKALHLSQSMNPCT